MQSAFAVTLVVPPSRVAAGRAPVLPVRNGAVADLNVVAPAPIVAAGVPNVAVLVQNVAGVVRSVAADRCAPARNVVVAVPNAAADRAARVPIFEAAGRNLERVQSGSLGILFAGPAHRVSLAYGGDLLAYQCPHFAAVASALGVRISARFVQADRFSQVCQASRRVLHCRRGKVAKAHLKVSVQTAWNHFDPSRLERRVVDYFGLAG